MTDDALEEKHPKNAKPAPIQKRVFDMFGTEKGFANLTAKLVRNYLFCSQSNYWVLFCSNSCGNQSCNPREEHADCN